MRHGLASPLAADRLKALCQLRCTGPMSESFDLERQKCQLFEWIEQAQPPIELEAIDNAGRWTEKYVLRAQIAVALDDVRGALRKRIACQRDEFELPRCDALAEILRS